MEQPNWYTEKDGGSWLQWPDTWTILPSQITPITNKPIQLINCNVYSMVWGEYAAPTKRWDYKNGFTFPDQEQQPEDVDMVNHPPHYTAHPSGVECIQITEHMNFNIGNAVKYLWRCDLKRDAIEDLEKVIFYVQREINRRTEDADSNTSR